VIELASLIRDLRAELQQAAAAGDGQALGFELGPIELEVEVAVQRSGGVGSTVRFFVIELGGDVELGATGTQRIKLTLTPHLGAGGEPPYVSGRAEPGER
jgi:hypothetical protein